MKTLGLNHLSWHRGFTIDGEDVWPQVIQGYIAELKKEEDPEWEPRMIEILRMIPNYYMQYFYHTDRKLKSQEQWPPSRAEEVIEIEKDLLLEYADPDLKEPPADLMKRGGAYYSTVATQLLNAHYNDLGETHVVNIKNNRGNFSQCDSLLLGDKCGAHTFPYLEINNSAAKMEHEATTSKIGEDQIFYLNQR